MATLYAISYPDHKVARDALAMAESLETAGYLTIHEQALVLKDEAGHVALDEERHPVRTGAVAGGVIGGIAGLLFLAPVAGAAIGAGLGALVGKNEASGASGDFKSFVETSGQELDNGGAAVVILGETDARERVVQSLGFYGGTVHSFDISAEDLAALQREVDKYSAKE